MLYTVLEPCCTLRGGEEYITEKKEEGRYADGRMEVRVTRRAVAPGREEIVTAWVNRGETPVECQPEIRVRGSLSLPGI